MNAMLKHSISKIRYAPMCEKTNPQNLVFTTMFANSFDCVNRRK